MVAVVVLSQEESGLDNSLPSISTGLCCQMCATVSSSPASLDCLIFLMAFITSALKLGNS